MWAWLVIVGIAAPGVGRKDRPGRNVEHASSPETAGWSTRKLKEADDAYVVVDGG